MAESKNAYSDNEYTIMSEITDNKNLSQRELSKKLGISVSTVNVLVNKMVKEGLIKMNKVSQRQVLYMLTPVGMMEKAKKTVSYLKAHYRVIYETKEEIKVIFKELEKEHDAIFILMRDDEISEMLSIAVKEFSSNNNGSNIIAIDNNTKDNIKKYKSPVLVHITADEENLKEYENIVNLKILNLIEKL